MIRLFSIALLLLLPAMASAQDASIADLRQRVSRLRERSPSPVPEGSLTSIEYLLDISARIQGRFDPQSNAWRQRAAAFIASAESGRDPFVEGRGQILNRGYDPSFSPARQGYAIYIPPNYDPSRPCPMMVILHGGSSIGNLFLGVVLGNNMDWLTYNVHLYDDYTPRWSPEFIVVAPDGVGQSIWRWTAEQDVLEVIADVRRHYNVDSERIVLGGVSNGGMGAYSIGARHAWMFSSVQAIAGAPSWFQYAGGRPTPPERTAIQRYSAMDLIENSTNTDFRYYHGTRDPGPMRPAFVRELTQHMRGLGLTPQERWYEHGHDLLYLVHRHGNVYPELAQLRRNPHPREVRIVTGDYRANRQHWVTVTRIENYPELARARATAENGRIVAETSNVIELALDLRDAPLGSGRTAHIEIDGTEIYDGPRAPLGHVVHAAKGADGRWTLGFLPPPDGLEKVPGLSGPMTDAYHDEIVHVYGTQNAASTEDLRTAANAGANGWPQGVWYLNQRVIADTEVTDQLMRTTHLALYGSPGDNSVLERIAAQLPIRAEGGAIVLSSGERFAGNDVGARFVYPNPLAPNRYVLVHTGVTAAAVTRTRNLPDFMPDYVVYDRTTTASRPRLIAGRNRQLAAGYFDRFWRLAAPPQGASDATGAAEPESQEGTELPPGVTAEQMRAFAIAVGARPDTILPAAVFAQTPAPELEPGVVPEAPRRPRRFLAPEEDPAGVIARQIARMVPGFYNFRAIIPGGVWTTSDRIVWRIRPEPDCLTALDEAEIPYSRWTEPLTTPTPTPVLITEAVGGVTYASIRAEEPVLVSCELAARLPQLSRILRRHGVRRAVILSSHRDHPRQSFHTLGMALDLLSFDTRRGRMSVNDHFVETPAHRTCEAPVPDDWRAAELLALACDLATSERFSSVLTPNYNDGHRNHFHIDIRPDDNRIFVR